MGKRGLIALAGAAAIACLIVGPSALGTPQKPHKVHHFASSVTFDGYITHRSATGRAGSSARGAPVGFDFYGLVRSDKGKCRTAGRRVDLIHLNQGTLPDKHLGFDLSDSNGGWSVFKPRPVLTSGTYLAKLKRKKVGGDICGSDSATFEIAPLRH